MTGQSKIPNKVKIFKLLFIILFLSLFYFIFSFSFRSMVSSMCMFSFVLRRQQAGRRWKNDGIGNRENEVRKQYEILWPFCFAFSDFLFTESEAKKTFLKMENKGTWFLGFSAFAQLLRAAHSSTRTSQWCYRPSSTSGADESKNQGGYCAIHLRM